MITLTNPKVVNTVLGGTATVNYDKLVVTNISYDTINKQISGQVKVTCTLDAAQIPLLGNFSILPQASPATVTLTIAGFPFNRTINLTGAQQTSVLGWFDTNQAQIENGFISVVMAAGTQATGV
jgi:hypothetical protein